MFEGADGLFLVVQDQASPDAPVPGAAPTRALEEADPSKVVGDRHKVSEYDGHPALNAGAINDRPDEIAAAAGPDRRGGQYLKLQGISSASIVSQQFVQDGGNIVDTATGVIYEPVEGTFTATDGSARHADAQLPGARSGSTTTSEHVHRTTPSAARSCGCSSGRIVFSTLTVASSFALGLLLAHAVRQRADAGQEDLPDADDHPVRPADVHDHPGVAGHAQRVIRHRQRDPAVRRALADRRQLGEVLGAARQPVAGLRLHVPGEHRRAPGHPERPEGGRLRRRRDGFKAFRRHHPPAAAHRGGAGAHRLVRVQLQQLQPDLPAHQRRPAASAARSPARPTS